MSLCSKFMIIQKNIKKKSLPGGILRLHFAKGTPRCSCLPAVFTLEAAVVLPLTAVFFVSILFFFRIMQVQLEVQRALDNTGRKLAVYLAEDTEDTGVGKNITANALLAKELAGNSVVKMYLDGGAAGISLGKSSYGGRNVKLEASYRICFPVNFPGLQKIRIVQRAACRKWTGWQLPADEDEDVWVYIAATGTVYHITDTCTHLKLSVRQVDREMVGTMRNEDGARYRVCRLCSKQETGKIVYITKEGDRYHSVPGCSAIKRTIYRIRISEAEERRACRKCMKEKGKK